MSKEIVRVCPPFVMTFSKLDYHDRVAGGILNCPPLSFGRGNRFFNTIMTVFDFEERGFQGVLLLPEGTLRCINRFPV